MGMKVGRDKRGLFSLPAGDCRSKPGTHGWRLAPFPPGTGTDEAAPGWYNGRGDNYCFRRGTGAFQQAPCGAGLELFPDSPTHGLVRPAQPVPLTQYEANLHATRLEWEVDET